MVLRLLTALRVLVVQISCRESTPKQSNLRLENRWYDEVHTLLYDTSDPRFENIVCRLNYLAHPTKICDPHWSSIVRDFACGICKAFI